MVFRSAACSSALIRLLHILFFAVIAPILFAVAYGKWWYGLIIFFGGMSVGAGVLILMFREKSQILALLGMGGCSLMLGYALMLRIG